MIASLRAASAAGPSTASPALSGPRWASVSRIASTSARSGGAPSSRTSPQIPHMGRPGPPYAPSAARSSRAARSGSAASPIARTTAMRVAPAATTSATFVASMPPIANQG